MSDKKNRIGMEFSFGGNDDEGITRTEIKNSAPPPKRKSSGNFHTLVWGDFSGRANRKLEDASNLSKRKFVEVDRDNIEMILESFAIELTLNLGGDDPVPVTIPLKSLDDFHPDELYENVSLFSQLRSIRRRLQNNNTFDEAAAEIQGWLIRDEPKQEDPPRETVASIVGDSLLDSMIGNMQGTSADAQSKSGSALADQFIRNIVAPYVERASHPKQDEMVAAVDNAISAHMQSILHHPDFQALESAWRALDFLVSRTDTGSDLKIYLFDVSKQELQNDLLQSNASESGLYKRFCDRGSGDLEFSLIVGNYSFADKVTDVLLLSQIGTVVQQAGAVFIAAADERLAGCESLAKYPDVDDWKHEWKDGFTNAWNIVRESTVAKHVGLALPGFLLRNPYGERSKPIDAFPFEEMPATHCHGCYLWGNAAFLKAEQIMRAFTHGGWSLPVNEMYQTDNLPLHYYDDDGEQMIKPTAEIHLTERGGKQLQQRGLIALWSVKNSDAVRSSDFSSLANDGVALF